MALKEGDFIEIEYTGVLKDSGIVFDTTSVENAKKAGLYDAKKHYGPATVCIGEGQLLKGLDEKIRDKELNKDHKIELRAEEAFGKKNVELIQMVAASKFKEQRVQAIPGMQVNIDGNIGTIKNASGGRVLIDFNHPLAGAELVYDIKIVKKIDDDAQKIKSIFEVELRLTDVNVTVNESKAKVEFKNSDKFPSELKDIIKAKILKLIPTLKSIDF